MRTPGKHWTGLYRTERLISLTRLIYYYIYLVAVRVIGRERDRLREIELLGMFTYLQ